jgi:hypothetical protein
MTHKIETPNDEVYLEKKLQAGKYEIPLSINQNTNYNLQSGVYFYTIENDNSRITRKMLIIK